jgi:hypothetical protein
VKSGGVEDITVSRILYIVQGVGDAESVNMGAGQKSIMDECRGHCITCPSIFCSSNVLE